MMATEDVDLWEILNALHKKFRDNKKFEKNLSEIFATSPQILFFIQGKDQDTWTTPQTESFTQALLDTLIHYYNTNHENGLYTKPVIHNKLRAETRPGYIDTFHIVIFARKVEKNSFPELILITENERTLHLVIPCVFMLPVHYGASYDKALLTKENLQNMDSRTLLMRMNLSQKFRGQTPPKLLSYIARAAREVEYRITGTEGREVRYISYILQASTTNGWIVDTNIREDVAHIAKKTNELYSADETLWKKTKEAFGFKGENIDIAKMADLQTRREFDPRVQFYLLPNGTVYRNAPIMFLREVVQDTQNIEKVTNRLLLYCRIPVPRHNGYPRGDATSFITSELMGDPYMTLETWKREQIDTLFSAIRDALNIEFKKIVIPLLTSQFT